MPNDTALEEIAEVLKTHPAKILLWESAPSDAIAARMREKLGLESKVFSPCEVPPGAPEDYLSVMRRNLDVARKVFGQ